MNRKRVLAAISPDLVVRNYFVDEAGDPTIFGRGGKLLVGQEGCSKTFTLGLAWIKNPQKCVEELESLRQSLLADPYFKNVPSMQSEERKTAIAFHAKNDLPEVRREVFRLIAGFDISVRAVIRRKAVLAQSVQTTRKHGGKAKFSPHDLYDDMVKRLLTNQLHQADETRIVFARRGKTARKDALEQAIEKAKRRNHPETSMTIVDALYPSESGCLQIIDYCMWALQRFLERGESRFFELLTSSFASIKDLDDTRMRKTGEWYSATNPLTPERLLPTKNASPPAS